jgi:N-acetylneuraminate synthase
MSSPQHTEIIAEAGVNHNGSLDRALEMVDVAAEAGADTIKFQTFRSERLVTRAAPKARYQRQTTDGGDSQFEMLRRLELDDAMHRALLARCRDRGIKFLSTPFDPRSLRYLAEDLGLPVLKISSGDLTNPLVLLEAGRSGRQVILSTGMATLAEIEAALAVLAFGYAAGTEPPSTTAFEAAWGKPEGRAAVAQNVVVLHCTTEYPAPFEEVNLRAMATIAAAFGLRVGYSDHTTGLAVPIAAAALGAAVIEKHFTLDRGLPGPDHAASLEPDELKRMVRSIREVEQALGRAEKAPSASETDNIPVARKSLTATAEIAAGAPFTAENLTVKRPGNGVSPMRYWDMLGRVSDRAYRADETIE